MQTSAAHDDIIANLRTTGQMPPAPRREHELHELTWRHRAVIHLMIHGLCDRGLAAFVVRSRREKIDGEWAVIDMPPPEPGEPLTIEEAGRLLGFRKAYCRMLGEKPLFEKALRASKREANMQSKNSEATDVV